MYHKWQSYDAWFWDVEHNRQNFLSFWTIFCPFTPLTTQKLKFLKKWKRPWRYYHFIHVHNKWQSNDLWFLRCGLQWTEIFVIWEHLWHFYPPKNWKIKHFFFFRKNWKKTLGDIITLHMRTIHENHMTYGSWYMERTGHNFLWFWTILCPFTPLTTQKIKTFKKGKKPWRYDAIILHMPLINDKFLSSWTFFAHLPP